MRSFKDYTPTGEQTGEQSSGRSSETKGAGGEPLTAAELTQKLASAWSGKSSGEMLSQILAEAERSKKNGALTNEEIEEFYNQFAPLLDGFQRRALRSVVERLKGL